MSKYGGISGPYFPVLGLNTGKYGPEITPYLNTFHAVFMMMMNCVCGMVERRKTFSLISSRVHRQRSSSSLISDTPRAGLEPAQRLSSCFVE